jgi:predicted alpha/beta hydrolase family esterase
MTRVFMIHGFEGEPNGGWRPWLMGKLAHEDVYACALPMPTPEHPKKDAWVNEIARVVGVPNEQTFLVGHSLGGPAILRYLETLSSGTKIGGVMLVSSPIQNSTSESAEKMETFFDAPFDFDHIKTAADSFVVIHGDNDPVVPYTQAVELASLLGSNLIAIKNGGHLNGSSGWYELPAAFDALMNLIKNTK